MARLVLGPARGEKLQQNRRDHPITELAKRGHESCTDTTRRARDDRDFPFRIRDGLSQEFATNGQTEWIWFFTRCHGSTAMYFASCGIYRNPRGYSAGVAL